MAQTAGCELKCEPPSATTAELIALMAAIEPMMRPLAEPRPTGIEG
jgi:hypothetical protein